MSTGTSPTAHEIAMFLDCDFPSSYFIQIDTGWREINGERVGGWHVHIVGPRVDVQTHSESFIEAVRECLIESGLANRDDFPPEARR